MGLKQANKLVEIVLKSLKDIEEITGVKTKIPHVIYETKKPELSDFEELVGNQAVAQLKEYGGIDMPDGISTMDFQGNLIVQTHLPNVSQNDLARSALDMTAELIIRGGSLDVHGSGFPFQPSGKKLSKKQFEKVRNNIEKKCAVDIYQIIPGNNPVKQLRYGDLIKEIRKNLKTNNKDILTQEYTRYFSHKGIQVAIFIGNFMQSYLNRVLESRKFYGVLKQIPPKVYNLILHSLTGAFVKSADSVVSEEISQAGKAIKYSYQLGECAEMLRGPKELEKILAIEPSKFAAYANNLYQEAKRLASKHP